MQEFFVMLNCDKAIIIILYFICVICVSELGNIKIINFPMKSSFSPQFSEEKILKHFLYGGREGGGG